jgi:predicted heme/steroid binding protein
MHLTDKDGNVYGWGGLEIIGPDGKPKVIDQGLTSVGLSMPSAFTVSNSPLTSNGIIGVTGAGTNLEYIDGTGALRTFPSLTGYVPYTGATQNVNLGVYSLTANSLIKAGGTSTQFLKADGSVDNSAYITLTALSAVAPLNYNNLTGAFSIAQATTSSNGYLSSTDWNVFNGKQNAITLTTIGSSGPATFIGSTLNIPDYNSALTGYVPNSRTLTINGTTYDLSANRTWNVGTVTAVTATGPLSSSGGTTPDITISQASGTDDGYLSSTDWTTFNNKQPAGNYITALSGEATGSGPGVASVTLNNASVTAKVLTGVNIIGGSISASDSILTAFGKLQNQINGLIGSSIYQGVWNASTNNPALTSGVGTRGYYYIVNVAGSTNLDGITDWNVGDWAIFDGTAWQQVDNTDSVTSVNGQTGAVSLTTDNIPEGAVNQYFTSLRARQSLSLTTSGSSGAATYNNGTGVFNIPNYTLSGLGGVPSSRTLTINGTTYDLSTDRSWNVGTVTSVDMTVPTGFVISGNPITSSGTLALTFNSDYSLPTIASQLEWDTAYDDMIVSASVTGTTTKTLTLNQQDGGTITTSWTDYDTAPVTSVFGRTGAVVAQSGDYSTSLVTEGSNLYYTDARARAAISLTTTGTSGAATYNNGTGVLNIPQYQSVLTNPVTGTGTANYVARWISSSEISTGVLYDNGTNVGIGTSSPGYKLTVDGYIFAIDYYIQNSLGTNGTFRLDGYQDYLYIWGDSSALAGYRFGSDTAGVVAQIGTNGNIGIGTTTPANKLSISSGTFNNGATVASILNTSSTQKAHVVYDTFLIQQDDAPTLRLYETLENLSTTISSDGGLTSFATTGEMGLFVAGSSAAPGWTGLNGIQAIRINISGNIGIGTTSIPGNTTNKVLAIEGSDSANLLITETGGAAAAFTSFGNEAYIGTSTNHPFYMYTNGVERMRITNAGNIGIGTSSPSAKLHVNGTFISNALWTDNTSVGYWGAYSTAYGYLTWDAGFARIGAMPGNRLDFSTNGSTLAMTIATDGNIGIGTTGPNSLLSATERVLLIENSNLASLYLSSLVGHKWSMSSAGDGALVWWDLNSVAERMRINSSGNVGINTSSPAYKLTVAGRTYVDQFQYNQGIPISGTNLNDWTDAGFYAGSGLTNAPEAVGWYFVTVERHSDSSWVHQTATSYGAGNTANRVYTRVKSGGTWGAWKELADNASISGTTNYVSKFTSGNTIGNSLIYDNGTNLGIGTTTPSGALHVATFGQYSYFSSNSGGASIADVQGLAIGWNKSAGGGETIIAYNKGGGATGGLAFSCNDGGSYAERMRITSGGNVGIGTTSPASKLHVKESASSSSQIRMSAASSEANYGYLTMTDNTFNTARLTIGTTFGYNTPVDTITLFNGSVGIGTTNPSQKLTVDSGNIYVSQGGFIAYRTDGGTGLEVNGGDLGPGSFIARFRDYSNNDRVVINGIGDVGIGITNPSTKLHVVGVASIGQNTNGTAVIDAYSANAYYGCNTATNGITINPSGYVGIGTTNPTYRLHVSGTAYINDTLYVNGFTTVDDSLYVTGAFVDSNGQAGTSGQILSSTGLGTDWVDSPTSTATSVAQLLPSATVNYSWTGQVIDGTWVDIFTRANNILTSGVWTVTMYVSDFGQGGAHYQYRYSGTMTWYQGGTNQTGLPAASEIALHRMGHAANNCILYLRTTEEAASDGGNGKLQINANYSNTSNTTITFTFVKII